MRSVKVTLFIVAIACTLLSCKKGSEDGGPDCESNNTTTVAFTNTGSIPLRVRVSISLTPMFEPVSPIITLDLAAGATVTKEFQADKYFIVWDRDCATTCSRVTYYSKTYTQCLQYEEKQGI